MTLTLPHRSHSIHLPDIRRSDPPVEPAAHENLCAMPAEAWELFERIRNSPEQRRDPGAMHCHPLLVEAARQWVCFSFQNNFFAHELPWGETCHEFLRGPQIRYPLPAWYPKKGNFVQSLGGNTITVDDQYNGWLTSPPHFAHVFGRNPTSLEQTEIGVWYLYADGLPDRWGNPNRVDAHWCWFSCPAVPPATDREAQRQYYGRPIRIADFPIL